MSFSPYVYNQKKNILFLGKGPTDGLNGTRVTAEKEYSNNFTEQFYKLTL